MAPKFRKETKRRISPIVGWALYPTLSILVVGISGYFYFQHLNYNSALEATRKWARLNEFPATAVHLTVATRGNMFTREITVEFTAPLTDIKKWLNDSPGTSNVTPTVSGEVLHFQIEPGGGAIQAELELKEGSGHVAINTTWS